MPRLHCRIKHDPTLKLTVTWLKDDAPLYIGNRSVFNSVVGLLSQNCQTFYRTFQESPGIIWINVKFPPRPYLLFSMLLMLLAASTDAAWQLKLTYQ